VELLIEVAKLDRLLSTLLKHLENSEVGTLPRRPLLAGGGIHA
jgi:hypothetical protein